jgi:signal transduction histidine kinase
MNMDGLLDASAADRSAPQASRAAEPRQLFRGLSHELCRPLISLRAGFDLLLAGAEGPISPDQRCHVQGLRAQCDEMIRLTRTYLDHTSLVRSSVPIEWAAFRLGALLDEAARQFSGRAWARGIEWECILEGVDREVETDLGCFQQVLLRLVENALAHTPTGGRIVLSARAEADLWCVDVADNGPGIPVEEIDRVFEPLVRLSDGNRKSCGGLGMGLTVCRELVERLGGEIRLVSAPEVGTRVTIEFPRLRK